MGLEYFANVEERLRLQQMTLSARETEVSLYQPISTDDLEAFDYSPAPSWPGMRFIQERFGMARTSFLSGIGRMLGFDRAQEGGLFIDTGFGDGEEPRQLVPIDRPNMR